MKGSEFAAAFAAKGLPAWEAAALAMARANDPSVVRWPLVDVRIFGLGHELVVRVASDVLAIGEIGDVLRLPLLPLTAQRIADAFGMVLPTSRLVREIHRAAGIKLDPKSSPPLALSPNKGADMSQYVEHSKRVDDKITSVRVTVPNLLVSGQGKDIVIGRALKPGKVVIYGWMIGRGVEDPPVDDPTPYAYVDWREQPLSNVHGDFYVDYSHGIRLLSPEVTLDGSKTTLAAIMADSALAPIVSDEGVLSLSQMRYGATPTGAPLSWGSVPSLDAEGLHTAKEHFDALYPRRSES